jgi:ubiquinone/menaquinone biosynthesis C-methylase UbiE
MPPPAEKRFIPALRFRALTPVYDLVAAFTVRERKLKQRLLLQADLTGPLEVLDLACGTGTLAIWAKQQAPQIRIRGIDADEQVLSRARIKSMKAGLPIEFDQGFSTALPYEDGSFDRVTSTMFFHHLVDRDKEATFREVVRVLKPDGQIHVADYGKPIDPLMATLSFSIRAFDGRAPTQANFEGRLPEMFTAAGLGEVRTEGELRTIYGSVSFYSARKS